MACPFVTGEELTTAVDELFDYRVFSELETDIVSHPMVADISSCTVPGQEAIQKFIDKINAGRAIKARDDELSPFYLMLADYIECGESPCENPGNIVH